DRVDPHADGGEVARGGNGHPDDPAFGRRVGDLSGLALDPGDRRGVDDYSALAVGVDWLSLRDGGRADPHQVKGADQVDVDDLAVPPEVMRLAIPPDGTRRKADARAADDDPQRSTQPLGRR